MRHLLANDVLKKDGTHTNHTPIPQDHVMEDGLVTDDHTVPDGHAASGTDMDHHIVLDARSLPDFYRAEICSQHGARTDETVVADTGLTDNRRRRMDKNAYTNGRPLVAKVVYGHSAAYHATGEGSKTKIPSCAPVNFH
jgi:hypothetical protein